MKVLVYIHSFIIGGAETVITNYILEMKKRNVDVNVVINQKTNSFLEKKIIDNNIKIYELFPKISFFKKIIRKVFRNLYLKNYWNSIIKTFKPDVLYLNTNLRFYDLKCFDSKKVYFSFHTDVKRHISMFGKKEKIKLDFLAKNGASFFAISSLIESQIKEILKTNNIFKVFNGIDIEYVKKNKYKRNDILAEYNISDDAFILGHVGRFNSVKNHEKIIDVFAELHKINSNSYLFLIGSGSDDERDRVFSEIERRKLRNNVICFGIRDDASLLMAAFDAFVFPSYIEGLPLVMIEAQALNIRCVASLGIPDDVVCNSNVFRLDLNESSEKWARLLMDNSKSHEEKSLNFFDINYVIEKILSIFKNKKGC